MIPDYIWQFIKAWEGGDTITNDPADTGGLTKFGISQANNPDVDVVNLTECKAKAIYAVRYWDKSGCNDLFEYMHLLQFNCAVNCGSRTAIRVLQKVVGAKPDGVLGQKTLARVRAYGNKPKRFSVWYATYQVLYYFNIVERRKSQHKWLKGWIRRTISAVWDTSAHFGKPDKFNVKDNGVK